MRLRDSIQAQKDHARLDSTEGQARYVIAQWRAQRGALAGVICGAFAVGVLALLVGWSGLLVVVCAVVGLVCAAMFQAGARRARAAREWLEEAEPYLEQINSESLSAPATQAADSSASPTASR